MYHYTGDWAGSRRISGRAPVAHGLKLPPANSSRHPISKKNHHKKRAGGVAQGVGSEFKL
jgi:hypothetical protein